MFIWSTFYEIGLYIDEQFHFQTPTYQVVFAILVLRLKVYIQEISNLKSKESSLW